MKSKEVPRDINRHSMGRVSNRVEGQRRDVGAAAVDLILERSAAKVVAYLKWKLLVSTCHAVKHNACNLCPIGEFWRYGRVWW